MNYKKELSAKLLMQHYGYPRGEDRFIGFFKLSKERSRFVNILPFASLYEEDLKKIEKVRKMITPHQLRMEYIVLAQKLYDETIRLISDQNNYASDFLASKVLPNSIEYAYFKQMIHGIITDVERQYPLSFLDRILTLYCIFQYNAEPDFVRFGTGSQATKLKDMIDRYSNPLNMEGIMLFAEVLHEKMKRCGYKTLTFVTKQ